MNLDFHKIDKIAKINLGNPENLTEILVRQKEKYVILQEGKKNKKMENNKYEIFKKEDSQKSKILKEAFNISDNDARLIDDWFLLFLEKHAQADCFDKGLIYETKLKNLHNQNIEKLNKQCYKYILPKLISYFNIADSGYLQSTIIARLGVLLRDLIAEYIDNKKVVYSPLEFVSLTNYLKHNFLISPNGNLIENILKIEAENKICSKSDKEQRTAVVVNILGINADKGFHHDIVCFKKILKLITPNDAELINHIKQYTVKNKQGCYEFIHLLFCAPLSDTICHDFDLKKEILHWLDSAVGANPKQTWTDKMENIKNKSGFENLLLLCERIVERDELKNYYFNEQKTSFWGDDVSKRFIKSAKWTIMTLTF